MSIRGAASPQIRNIRHRNNKLYTPHHRHIHILTIQAGDYKRNQGCVKQCPLNNILQTQRLTNIIMQGDEYHILKEQNA